MNKRRVYVTSPFLSLAQTSECQGTTSPQHGCKGPRSEPLELLGANRKTQHSRCYFRKSDGGNYASPKGTREFDAQLQKWVIGAGTRACRMGPDAAALLWSSTLPTFCHQTYLIHQDVQQKAHPCTASSRIWWMPVLPVSADGRVQSRTNGGDLHQRRPQTDAIFPALFVFIRAWNCVGFYFFCYLDHLRGHFPSKSTQKRKGLLLKSTAQQDIYMKEQITPLHPCGWSLSHGWILE